MFAPGFFVHSHMDLSARYQRNENMLSPSENERLRTFRVAVVGCGGLGGHLIEMLARLGLGHITAIDGDVFEASNLNRQLLATPHNLGHPKALEAEKRIRLINPDVSVKAIHAFLNRDNAPAYLAGHDLICDALDNIPSRQMLEKAAASLDIPLVFGAIAGWHAHVGSVFPGDGLMEIIYPHGQEKGLESELGNPSFTPALAAALQVAESVKILLGKEGILRKKMLVINTLNHEYQVIDLD